MVENVHPQEKMPSPITMESARLELLDQRARFATMIGVPLFALNCIEPWFDFHDLMGVKIQMVTSFVMLCLALLSFTRWGSRQKLTIFTMGFLTAVCGYECIISYEQAFGTAYSDGFPTLYAFYAVLIPSTIPETALIGMAVMALTSGPEALIKGDISVLSSAAISNVTPFAILLCGRAMANKLWEREFRARQQSESLYKQLVQSEKMAALGRLAAGMAHELNNPLAIIASNVETIERIAARLFAKGELKQVDASGAKLSRAIERLRVGTDRLCSVNDLLRQYVSPPHQEMVPSDVNLQIDLALSLIESKAAKKAIAIHRETSAKTMLLCDPQTLSHVFVNLLDNACDAIERGGTIWVRTEISAEGGLQIAVRDDGPGVAESIHGRIGEPFVTTKDPGKGLGLGLALCKLIIEKHHGKLELANRNPGVEAIVTFPASSLYPENSSTAITLPG